MLYCYRQSNEARTCRTAAGPHLFKEVTMKKWFLDTFLPMWAKETVLQDNRILVRRIRELQQENSRLSAYIQGLEKGIRSHRYGGER